MATKLLLRGYRQPVTFDRNSIGPRVPPDKIVYRRQRSGFFYPIRIVVEMEAMRF